MSDTLTDHTTEIAEQLLADVLEPERLNIGDRFLIQTLALVTARIQQEPENAPPSMISQQRQLLRAYNGLRKPDVWEL